MNQHQLLFPVFALFFLLLTACNTNDQNSARIKAFLDEALDSIRLNAMNSGQVDWEKLRAGVKARAEGATTTQATYPAIRYALEQLQDNHSFLQLSDSLAALEAASRPTGASADGEEESRAPSPYGSRMKIEWEIHSRNGQRVGRIFVPQGMRDNAFAQQLHDRIVEMAAEKPCGWIVDLRGNGGGDMWPMLAGVGHLVGDNPLGGSVNHDGEHDYIKYEEGRSFLENADGSIVPGAEVKEAPLQLPDKQPLAYLIDRGTASSGEALAVIFKGRENTRGFGEKTHGATTATMGYKLSDGANLVLAVSTFEDRHQKPYPAGVEPDVEITIGSEMLDPTEDPVINAAIDWIVQQEACK